MDLLRLEASQDYELATYFYLIDANILTERQASLHKAARVSSFINVMAEQSVTNLAVTESFVFCHNINGVAILFTEYVIDKACFRRNICQLPHVKFRDDLRHWELRLVIVHFDLLLTRGYVVSVIQLKLLAAPGRQDLVTTLEAIFTRFDLHRCEASHSVKSNNRLQLLWVLRNHGKGVAHSEHVLERSRVG